MENYEQHIESRIAAAIVCYVSPVLVLLGTFGNVLTISVLMRKKYRETSTARFLSTLAFSDMMVLWTGGFTLWLMYMFKIDVTSLSRASCKLPYFLLYTFTQCSTWLVVSVTIERVIVVLTPHKYSSICTARTAFYICIVILVLLATVNTHFLYGLDINEQNICYPINEEYSYFFNQLWPFIDMFMYFVLPVSIMLIGNIIIGAGMIIRKRRTTSRAPSNRPSATTENLSPMMTTLVTVSLVHIICETPLTAFLILHMNWLLERETTAHDAVLDLWWTTLFMFMYVNHAVNFMLYFLRGSKFRQDVKLLLCSWQIPRFLYGRERQTGRRMTITKSSEISKSDKPDIDNSDGAKTQPIERISTIS